MMPRERIPLSPEDLALYRADPDFAAELGITWPHCGRCGQLLKEVWWQWDGESPVYHAIPKACEWHLEAQPMTDFLEAQIEELHR